MYSNYLHGMFCSVDLPMPEHYVYAQGVFAVLAKTPFVNKSRQFLTSQRHNLSGTVWFGTSSC
jgi:hypothetical protein